MNSKIIHRHRKPFMYLILAILLPAAASLFLGQSQEPTEEPLNDLSSETEEDAQSFSSTLDPNQLMTNPADSTIAAKQTLKKGRHLELGTPIPSEKKYTKEIEVILNDPAMSQAWGLKMTDAQKAWRLSQGSRDIVVAVIDTGIDATHPDLTRNLWVNKGESGLDSKGRNKASNGIDDDKNGRIDDVHGWNFVGNNNNLTDNHGHGTHIAGIIGAEGGNGVGLSGVAPKVSLMILKYYDPKGTQTNSNLNNTVRAIDYAVKMNAHIINYSGGGLDQSAEERSAIERAMKKGILFVAAAGNEMSNSDVKGYYPADYGLANIVSVTAIDKSQNVLPSSNYGTRTVHIAAPGNNIYSTLPHGNYGFMTGTSQATAFVTGVAALIMAANSELKKADRVIKYLTQTGDTDSKLVGKTRYNKRLNSYRALAIQDGDLAFNGSHIANTPRSVSYVADTAKTTQTGNDTDNPDEIKTAEQNAASAPDQMASFLREMQKHLVNERTSEFKN